MNFTISAFAKDITFTKICSCDMKKFASIDREEARRYIERTSLVGYRKFADGTTVPVIHAKFLDSHVACIIHSDRLTEGAYITYIAIGEKFFDLDESTREVILSHEEGHHMDPAQRGENRRNSIAAWSATHSGYYARRPLSFEFAADDFAAQKTSRTAVIAALCESIENGADGHPEPETCKARMKERIQHQIAQL